MLYVSFQLYCHQEWMFLICTIKPCDSPRISRTVGYAYLTMLTKFLSFLSIIFFFMLCFSQQNIFSKNRQLFMKMILFSIFHKTSVNRLSIRCHITVKMKPFFIVVIEQSIALKWKQYIEKEKSKKSSFKWTSH